MLAAARDIAIVLLAVLSLVIGVLLAVLLVQLRILVRTLREEIAPILQTGQATAHRVDGTVHLVSDTIVRPLIKLNSFGAGVRKAADNLFFFKGRMQRGHGAPRPQTAPTDSSTTETA
jgi:hypothetical protein